MFRNQFPDSRLARSQLNQIFSAIGEKISNQWILLAIRLCKWLVCVG